MTWGSEVEIETKRRIRLLLAAYAYEYLNTEIMSDAEFDRECLKVNLEIKTNRPDIDQWFLHQFDPSTGQWIRRFPEEERKKLHRIYELYFEPKCANMDS